jgi:hypothetical protein
VRVTLSAAQRGPDTRRLLQPPARERRRCSPL